MSGVSPENVLGALSDMLLCKTEETDSYVPFCINAANYVTNLLRDKNDAENPIVINTAACIAYYRLCLSDYLSGGSVTSFTAGDITVSSNPQNMLKTAESLVSLALSDAAPFLNDNNFSFTAIS